MAGQMYVARESFVVMLDGEQTIVRAGVDLVREGHQLLSRYPEMFRPAPVRFDVEQATAAPGEKRGAPDPVAIAAGGSPRHVGGGMYETPDGQRFRGRDEAAAHMESPAS